MIEMVLEQLILTPLMLMQNIRGVKRSRKGMLLTWLMKLIGASSALTMMVQKDIAIAYSCANLVNDQSALAEDGGEEDSRAELLDLGRVKGVLAGQNPDI